MAAGEAAVAKLVHSGAQVQRLRTDVAGVVVGAVPGAVVRWAERVGNAWSSRGGSLMALRLG